LLPFCTYEEDLAGSDAVVDPDLVRGYLVTCFGPFGLIGRFRFIGALAPSIFLSVGSAAL
jgi:hypothetical protein